MIKFTKGFMFSFALTVLVLGNLTSYAMNKRPLKPMTNAALILIFAISANNKTE